MNESKLKEHLETLSKEQIIDLYLQKKFDCEVETIIDEIEARYVE